MRCPLPQVTSGPNRGRTWSPNLAWATGAASPEILSSRRALGITGSWRRSLHGGGSFRPRPAIACCAHAARDTSRTTRASHPPQVPRCAGKDPRIPLPVPCPRRSGNPRLLLLCGLVSGEFVRLTPVPSAVPPPRRPRLPAGIMPLGLPLLYRSYFLLSRKNRSPSEFSALRRAIPSLPRRRTQAQKEALQEIPRGLRPHAALARRRYRRRTETTPARHERHLARHMLNEPETESLPKPQTGRRMI